MSDSSARVLVVDDDLATRMVASAALATDGFDSTEAGGGREALELFERGAFDAVLLDVNMPDVDGYEVCRAIRAIDHGRDTAVMIVTASDDLDAVKAAFAAGATDFMTKPLDLPLLGHRVRFMLRASQTNSEARRARNEITRLAYYETVTGLPNTQFVERYSARRSPASVVAIDLGSHQLERLSPEMRRALARAAAGRISEQLRVEAISHLDPDDVTNPRIIARTGSDELLVMSHVPITHLELRNTAEALALPFTIEGRAFTLRPRLGAAGSPEATSDVVECARYAVQRAEVGAPRNIVRFTEVSRVQRDHVRVLLETLDRLLADGAETSDLLIDLVARRDPGSRELIGVRARAVWTALSSEELTRLLAANPGVADRFAWWALARGCEKAAGWLVQAPIRVAFEMPITALSSIDHAAYLVMVVTDAGLRPDWIDLELVGLPRDAIELERIAGIVKVLRERGFRVVFAGVDAATTLDQFRRICWDGLRVDRAAIDRNDGLFATLARLAEVFELRLAVSGIDTPAAEAMLDAHACSDVSGAIYDFERRNPSREESRLPR